MNNSTPEFSMRKEVMIKSYIHVLGYDERMTEVIYNILTLAPDITVYEDIKHYSKIRVIWSFVKAGYDVNSKGYMTPPNNPNYYGTALLNLIQLTKQLKELR